MISGIAGILCVVFVSKGKVSNYFFGLIFAYTYFYVTLKANFLGEMNTTLYVYIPAQFIGYFLWKQNLQKDQQGSDAVVAKSLTAMARPAPAAAFPVGRALALRASPSKTQHICM